MFRLPAALVSSEALRPYCVPNTITLETHGDYLILDIRMDKEEGEWIDTGEGRLTGMIPLRDAILAGDYRALYLAWLRACELELDTGVDSDENEDEEDTDEDEEYGGTFLTPATPEPPVPPNLKHLDGVLQAFIEFFEVDPLWVEVAAEASAAPRDSAEPLEQWILALPEAECRRLLLRAAQGEPNIAQLHPEGTAAALRVARTARRRAHTGRRANWRPACSKGRGVRQTRSAARMPRPVLAAWRHWKDAKPRPGNRSGRRLSNATPRAMTRRSTSCESCASLRSIAGSQRPFTAALRRSPKSSAGYRASGPGLSRRGCWKADAGKAPAHLHSPTLNPQP